VERYPVTAETVQAELYSEFVVPDSCTWNRCGRYHITTDKISGSLTSSYVPCSQGFQVIIRQDSDTILLDPISIWIGQFTSGFGWRMWYPDDVGLGE